ncbi:hypothetical protein VTN77DRAFT_495 [Rasamsonia byssochlamydoides]|uniref:uncharacterized protein n=1 Tax=Rasamsonia byssochlamydoides TaxID=89139 RepID=UPI00374272A6
MASTGFTNSQNHDEGMMPYGGAYGQPSQEPSKNPFISNMGFLKMLGQKKTTRDGQPAKRRGPKPDSKPALTRRQELNRQAQRTHRERKEQYIRALETEISRLREAYSNDIMSAHATLQQQREMLQNLREENNTLKEILRSCGIPFEAEFERRKAGVYPAESFGGGSSTTGSQSAGFPSSNPGFLTTPPSTFSPSTPGGSGGEQGEGNGGSFQAHAYQSSPTDRAGCLDFSSKVDSSKELPPTPGIFEEDPQLGIDFILTLEAPCRDHTEYLCRMSAKDVENESFFSGHALMASCPPPSHIENVPEGNLYPHQTYELPPANLETLLNLSKQLISEGQVTPIMVLQSLKNHELYHTLTREDVKTIIDTLYAKIRCYGFGAVIEDFELRDCLSSVLGSKLEAGLPPPNANRVGVGDDALYS